MIATFALAAILSLQPKTALKPPTVVAPGETAGAAPADATVLLDGKSLDGWTTRDGKPAAWKADGSSVMVVAKAGDIVSTKTFGDAQIHVEFMTPVESGDGQDRGNSGLYIHGRYEVQVLDSYKSETYPDGQCGAVYGKLVPLVNACRPQGQWQTYDIVFRAPRFDADGKKTSHARITAYLNGVLIHDNAEISGPTGGAVGSEEKPAGPLLLQEHGHPVQYRNVWFRPL
jgi:hypothetical protein